MEADDIILEDWKMTKDRIKHFDDVVMRTRLQGLPIAAALQAAAFVTSDTLGRISINADIWGSVISIHIFSLIILASLIYLIPVILLDVLHFKLLINAVNHAITIEDKEPFKDKLGITKALTSTKLTALHSIGAYLAYGLIIVVGVILFSSSSEIIAKLPNA